MNFIKAQNKLWESKTLIVGVIRKNIVCATILLEIAFEGDPAMTNIVTKDTTVDKDIFPSQGKATSHMRTHT